MSYKHLILIAIWVLGGCGGDDGATGAPPEDPTGQSPSAGNGKEDSGWLANDSYEVGAVVRSVIAYEASGEWEALGNDVALQLQVADTQLKFIKNTAESYEWRFNQLADTIRIIDVDKTDEPYLLITYEAVVDMVGKLNGDLPTLDEIETISFVAAVPLDPSNISSSQIDNCSKSDGSHSVQAYNFHYYYAPDQPNCDIKTQRAEIKITEVFERRIAYPEYDQLMQPLEDGTVGFHAALVPNTGDHDPRSRFDSHAAMLEQALNLEGKDSEDGMYRRYVWREGDVSMIIDLFDPSSLPWTTNFAASFREKLADYTLVHYNGHSSYGTKHLLDEPESFSDRYQIIEMHSCQSYAYYTRQVFRAKATEEDPSGFDLADIIATGRSSYPNGAPKTLRVLLDNLMKGMVAIANGEPERAPDWLSIMKGMDRAVWSDVMYGAAGVRTNTWQPASADTPE